jgi:hypothetical protein
MGKAPLPPRLKQEAKFLPLERTEQEPDLQALLNENAHLREVVTHLSELLLKNIVDECAHRSAPESPAWSKRAKQRGPAA